MGISCECEALVIYSALRKGSGPGATGLEVLQCSRTFTNYDGLPMPRGAFGS